MYLGHPTDNVQIKSLKKYDAQKRSTSRTTEKLFAVLILLYKHKAACRHMEHYTEKSLWFTTAASFWLGA